ncbi:MAG TPA: hypothetical protein VGN30_06615 [Steroidobacteraceae bacterium]
MHRRKVTVAAAAVFAIGIAFAAQPTSLRADWGESAPNPRSPWIPGTNSLISAHEPMASIMPPPR